MRRLSSLVLVFILALSVTGCSALTGPQPGATASDKSTPTPHDPFPMPSVVGMVLQDAQDLLQEKGAYLVNQEDATGMDRRQVVDSNWKVCRQSPAEGTIVTTTTIVTLWSVKLDESC